MNFEELIQSIEQTHNHLQGKAVSAVNQSLTIRNWLFGFYIVEYEQEGEDRAKYGEKLLATIVSKMKSKGMKGVTDRYLRYCRQFYIVYPQIAKLLSGNILPEPIWKTVYSKLTKIETPLDYKGLDVSILISRLSFSHIQELIKEENILKRAFYEIQTIKGNWSVRELARHKESLLYERTGLSINKEGLLANIHGHSELLTPEGIMRDPYVFEFLGLAPKEKYTESKLEEALIEHLQEFLLELGKGFCFEARQKRITIDDEYYYVDLVFYHRTLKCHVLVDLKTGKFNHLDVGQMNFYLNYFKDKEMQEGDNPPIGIILCSEKGSATVKYATGSIDNQMFISRYLVALPTEDELKTLMEAEQRFLGE